MKHLEDNVVLGQPSMIPEENEDLENASKPTPAMLRKNKGKVGIVHQAVNLEDLEIPTEVQDFKSPTFHDASKNPWSPAVGTPAENKPTKVTEPSQRLPKTECPW